ncbi:hypothetical protein WA158_002008 [Blastocystis sp. Blastoise]
MIGIQSNNNSTAIREGQNIFSSKDDVLKRYNLLSEEELYNSKKLRTSIINENNTKFRLNAKNNTESFEKIVRSPLTQKNIKVLNDKELKSFVIRKQEPILSPLSPIDSVSSVKSDNSVSTISMTPSEPVVRVYPSKQLTEALMTEFAKLRDYNVLSSETDNPFMIKLTKKYCNNNLRNYWETVKQPIDLPTVRQKIKSGKYATPQDFEKDMTLMIDNCRRYHVNNMEMMRHATSFNDLYVQTWKDIKRKYNLDNSTKP